MSLEPNCAICGAPAEPECPCESQRLTLAVQQAENRALETRLKESRDWVAQRAKDYVFQSFNRLREHRKLQYADHVRSLHQAAYYTTGAPHPTQLQQALATLRRAIDEDWKASVMRYPDVLDYFYNMIEIHRPRTASVKDHCQSERPEKHKKNRHSGQLQPHAAIRSHLNNYKTACT